MVDASLEIIACPPQRTVEALALALCEVAPDQRRAIAGALLDAGGSNLPGNHGLYIAVRNGRLCGSAWGQQQPGNTAVFWPPRLVADENGQTAHQLAAAVMRELDSAAVGMTQTLLALPEAEIVPVLTAAGFRHLADLLYLTCEADRFPTELSAAGELQFAVYEPTERSRMLDLIERTYEGTLDCAALGGTRSIEDVLDGYQATGVFRPENWLIVRGGGEDAGVLLLADHPAARHWELVYMGLVPAARGRGWGRYITRHAQWLARQADVERIVLAVDATNQPALDMYRSAGFETWHRRTVFVRFFR